MSKAKADPIREAELAALSALPDDEIDTSDIPEAPVENWAPARRGLYRPIKQPVTLRLDADVVEWFKAQLPERGYQTEINRVLRQHVMQAGAEGAASRARR